MKDINKRPIFWRVMQVLASPFVGLEPSEYADNSLLIWMVVLEIVVIGAIGFGLKCVIELP